MNKSETVQELKRHLRRFVVELLVSNYEATEQVGLNANDLASLCLLLLHGPTPAGRLAELTGLTSGAVTGLVDRLERGGFVRRELDPDDRRKVIVTADHARVEHGLFPHFPSLQRAAAPGFYTAFTNAELGVVTRFLARLTA
jgi:DNA-binding transcriptional ArsR family regulator